MHDAAQRKTNCYCMMITLANYSSYILVNNLNILRNEVDEEEKSDHDEEEIGDERFPSTGPLCVCMCIQLSIYWDDTSSYFK